MIPSPTEYPKLHSIGIGESALTWFKNYLSNRRQHVVVDGVASSWSAIQRGVLQGSLLDPLLFSIYTNDNNMPSTVTKSDINMYADDTALYTSDLNATAAANRVSIDLLSVHRWCTENSLTINCTKTQAMFLCQNNRWRQTSASRQQFCLMKPPFRSVSEFNYLGVILYSTKKNSDCISSRTYGALSTLRKTQTHLPLATRKMLYKSLVLPHLEYCPSIWDPSTKQLTHQVERVQNRAMHTILEKPSRTHSAPLRAA